MSAPNRSSEPDNTILEQVDRCTTQFDVLRLLREISAGFGYRYFFVAGDLLSDRLSFSDAVIITSAPAEFLQAFGTSMPGRDNTLARFLRMTGAPFELRPGGTAPAQDDFSFETAAADFDVDSVFVVPVYHPDHGPGVVVFAGKRPALSVAEMAELGLYGHRAHEKLRQVSAKPSKPESPLTERERECLVWTSNGKTSAEIAQILNLSEHTVNHYLNNAARKFNAVNRAQAVAHGLRLGYIA